MTDVYTALKPIYFLLKGLSLSTFTIEGAPDKLAIKRLSRWSYHKLPFYAFIILVVVWRVYFGVASVDVLRYHVNMVNLYVHIFKTYIMMTLFLSIAAVNETAGYKSWRIWTGVMHVDAMLKKLGCEIDNKSVQLHGVCKVMAWFVLIASLYTFEFTMTPIIIDAFAVVMFFWIDGYKGSMEVTFQTYNVLLASRFRSIDLKLRDEASVEAIKELANAHYDLVEIARLTNHVFSYLNLVAFGTNFILVVSKIHLIACFWIFDYDMTVLEVVVLGFWSSLYSLSNLMLISSSSSLTRQANHIKSTLIKRSTKLDKALRKEINAFSLQVLHCEVVISAGGFFVMDFGFLYTIVGTITMYFVILVQLDLTFIH